MHQSLRPWSSCYLTLLSEKQKQHWSGLTPHIPLVKLCKCRNMQQEVTKPYHKQTKCPTLCNSYLKRIKCCFRDLGTCHQWTISYNICCNPATLTCLGFSKLPLQLCAQLINRKESVNPAWSNCQQTLTLRTKAGKICLCFMFSENLISLPALSKKALDR